MLMVASVMPYKAPPAISMSILLALADMTEPANAMSGVMVTSILRSRTSERRPMMGHRTAWSSNGAYVHWVNSIIHAPFVLWGMLEVLTCKTQTDMF